MEKLFTRTLPALFLAICTLLVILPQTSGRVMAFVAQLVYGN